MELIDILFIRLINDLKDFNQHLKRLENVLSKDTRKANPCNIQESKNREPTDDASSKRSPN